MLESPGRFALGAPAIFDGEHFLRDHCVVIEGEHIAALLPAIDCPPGVPLKQLSTGTLAPGFVDLQVNGGGDVMLNSHPDTETLATLQRAHRSKGTTSILPTLLSDTRSVQEAAVAAVRSARGASSTGILGLHLEGPYFAPDRRGAHSADRLRHPDADDLDWLCSLNDLPVVLTLAPECISRDALARLARSGLMLCAGHSDASYAELEAVAANGVQGVTHLYNAMRQLQAREPGMVGAALTLDQLWVGIIADGHHVHPAAIRLAFRAKPAGKLILVSDAMATVGGSQGVCELYGETIREVQGRLLNRNGVLAGSAIGLIDAVRYAHKTAGLPLDEVLRMASLYPSQIMQLEHAIGRLRAGYRADLVHFDDAFTVRDTWLAGSGLETGDKP
tara:strand:- start:7083 stop:8252 length:1170 start_codon:yes stop_codon:yes gene_type:complete